jgi:RNA recognition motif-containing protein
MMEGPNRSKGYGVVKFATLEEAERAVQEYQGAQVQGRPLVVRLDKYHVTD